MPLRAIVARRRSWRMRSRSALPCVRYRLKLRHAREQRRQIEAVGLDDPALSVASAVALAVRAVLHGDQAELDQLAVERLDLGLRKAKRLPLQARPRARRSGASPRPSPAAG